MPILEIYSLPFTLEPEEYSLGDNPACATIAFGEILSISSNLNSANRNEKGELFGLKWSNIDFDYGFIELLETKSGRSRKIPISKKLLEVLENLDKSYEYVFINPETKEPYTDIKHSFTSVLEKAKIDNFRFHDLRHTVATRLVESGTDLAVVKEILGHAEISTTMRYAHPVPKRKLEAISVLNSYS